MEQHPPTMADIAFQAALDSEAFQVALDSEASASVIGGLAHDSQVRAAAERKRLRRLNRRSGSTTFLVQDHVTTRLASGRDPMPAGEAKSSRERSPKEFFADLAELARQRDPARMDQVDFLEWLDKAGVDELESFGQGQPMDSDIAYDPWTRTYTDARTCHRWADR